MPVVQTIRDKCKRCYSCVRNCPARAIKIIEGQAEVIKERCIGCGNCVLVCAQKAKKIESGIEHTKELLRSGNPVYALLAPSFPAAFPDDRPGQLVSALRQLGFAKVVEVAVGADMIAREYARLFRQSSMTTIISTPCPAIVEFIQKYHPALILHMAPIVSPMIATGRAVKAMYDPDCRLVFIGPCIAKKKEKVDQKVAGVIDEVLTYQELKEMFKARGIDLRSQADGRFDPPYPRTGRIFPVSGGLLRTAALEADILDNDIIVTEGPERVVEILERVEEGKVEARFLDLLFCRGCIAGPKMDNELSVFIRKDIVARYVRNRLAEQDAAAIERQFEELRAVPLSRGFTSDNQLRPVPTEAQVREILAKINKVRPEDELNCGACGYNTCREKAVAVFQGLAELEMCLPYLIDRLERMNREIVEAQERLIRSARLASMGELAAGVAHEINNPLAGVLTYLKLIQKKLAADQVPREDLAKFRQYLQTMEHETIRCSDIVKNLLEFARPSEPTITPLSVEETIKKSLFLVRHQITLQNIAIVERYEEGLPPIMADAKQMQQVLLNLVINAAQAMPEGGELRISAYRAHDQGENVVIVIQDTGVGIPAENLPRIFDPFFTTKASQKGTGLGLSVVSSIVAKHGGRIDVESEVGKGTTFKLFMPTKNMAQVEGVAAQ
ncbi:MAG: ATP-binding protein [candidate division KSB1 bacterium]|nr:ATP-binding protein [candidate division KSB1 bacterium]